ncbi:uncharacterized protein LOC129586831 isoform X2 [Paramacrobiotus metropolitanus]|uniref:uncharacterized protein LOC129586831 isoform X2 n=1 Tax=Paramacrobiotus metropolitanus TaxID=2943436 RepID=UPI0024461CBC|nr:uncharacterized protein LOC129586831 isoform X2 [Paramacrobiotus metropolitanus]
MAVNFVLFFMQHPLLFEVTVGWKFALLGTLVFATIERGTSIKCYECQYAFGEVPDYPSQNLKNCLDTRIKDCGSSTNHCAFTTVVYTKSKQYEVNVQKCGSGTLTPNSLNCAPFMDNSFGDGATATECKCAGKPVKCYECAYASGDVPEAWNDIKTNCLNSKTTDCDATTNHCKSATVAYTTPKEFQINSQGCGRANLTRDDMKCVPLIKNRESGNATSCSCIGDLCNLIIIPSSTEPYGRHAYPRQTTRKHRLYWRCCRHTKNHQLSKRNLQPVHYECSCAADPSKQLEICGVEISKKQRIAEVRDESWPYVSPPLHFAPYKKNAKLITDNTTTSNLITETMNAATVPLLSTMFVPVFCLIHYGPKTGIQHFRFSC